MQLFRYTDMPRSCRQVQLFRCTDRPRSCRQVQLFRYTDRPSHVGRTAVQVYRQAWGYEQLCSYTIQGGLRSCRQVHMFRYTDRSGVMWQAQLLVFSYTDRQSWSQVGSHLFRYRHRPWDTPEMEVRQMISLFSFRLFSYPQFWRKKQKQQKAHWHFWLTSKNTNAGNRTFFWVLHHCSFMRNIIIYNIYQKN